MDTIKNKDFFSKKKQSSRSDKQVYELVHSEELELLYKKNAHLLARLSKTGKENTQLYTKLSSIHKEKSHLGDKNKILKHKNLSLKEQISLFARQHREFNQQSHKLKEELEKIRNLPIKQEKNNSEDKNPLQKQIKDIQLLLKKEQIYKKQIGNLQKLYKEAKKETQREQEVVQKEKQQEVLALEEKIQTLYQALSKAQRQPVLINKLKDNNQALNKKCKSLEKKIQAVNKIYKSHLKDMQKQSSELEQNKNQIQEHREQVLLLTTRTKELEKENNNFQKKEKQLNETADQIKTEKLFVLKENKKLQIRKKEIKEFKKNQEDLLHYKEQNSQLIKQTEQLKSGFAKQLHLFTKERDCLKFQCENQQKALSAGKMGFDQAMISFQKKYIKIYNKNQELLKQLNKQKNQIQTLEKEKIHSTNELLKEREFSENKIKKETNKQISELSGKLETLEENKLHLEKQVQHFKEKAEDLSSKEKQKMKEEIQKLSWSQERSLTGLKENHLKEINSLKSDYEIRIKNTEASFQKKLQHIRIEMENDLCSEKKRYEVFKNIKMREQNEMNENLSFLQKENQELQIKTAVLEKSLEENKIKLDRYLKLNKQEEDQKENLKNLWQELQKQNEKKDQQIKALQRLNKSLSLSFNKIKKQDHSPSVKELKGESSNPKQTKVKKEEEELNKNSNQILADLHFG